MTIQPHTWDLVPRDGLPRNSRFPLGDTGGSYDPPDPGDLAGTWLAQAAGDMQPGDWHWPVGATLPAGESDFTSYWNRGSNDGGGVNSSNDFWAPIALWDSTSQRTYMILDRTGGTHDLHSVNFIGYEADGHNWLAYPIVERSDTSFGSPHVYGKWALDVQRQSFYRINGSTLWTFDIATGAWSTQSLPESWPVNNRTTVMHEELDRLLGMDSGGAIWALNLDTLERTSLGTAPNVPGGNDHGHAVYNRNRQEAMFQFDFATGYAALVDAQGNVTESADHSQSTESGYASTFPFYDPISGHYLWYLEEDRELWEYDAGQDQWALALTFSGEDYDWPPFHGHLIAVIDDLDVILWLHRTTADSGQRLYKHNAVL